MALAVVGDVLVWTDSAGAIWTMPALGGEAHQLSDQHGLGFTFRPVVAGGQVFVSAKRDFVHVTLPAGPAAKLGLALPEDPVHIAGDDRFIYATLFQRDTVLAIPVGGGAPRPLAKLRRALLALHGDTLYAISYSTGQLVAIPTAGGATRTVAKGFVRPTALEVDGTAAFVYTEKDETLRRVELATGATSVLASGLVNADDLVGDGAWLYTFSWPNRFVRVAKDGSRTEVLADDLKSPYDIAVAADAVYVISRDQNKIVRLRKRD
jgi:hypothetical protein